MGDFFDHALGHYTEFLNQIDIMTETRKFYRQAAARLQAWRDAYANSRNKKAGIPVINCDPNVTLNGHLN
jgi:hypothetical protein